MNFKAIEPRVKEESW